MTNVMTRRWFGRRWAEVFRAGVCRDGYVKPRDANGILRNEDLSIAARHGPELKAFLNTILTLAGGPLR